ncbi:MAG: SWF/SNF helicase family protein, partial [bacterium]|nr:SWF/SNF helicase family protein [bacterium]
IVERLRMEEEQFHIYAETARLYRDEVARSIEERGLAGSSIKVLEGMLRLRQICLAPQLVEKKFQGVSSIKFNHFKELLEDILSEGHKVLVFSQFVKVLGMIREHLDEEGVKYSYLDGSISLKKREREIKVFQESESTGVFLLSLKAGGVAINLTAADYVIIFDPWWNPAVEAQAIDRSHRIGQKRKVIVYRMVVRDSIEEKMLQLQDKKRELVDQLITSEVKGFKDLTAGDILGLFQ